MTTPDHASTVPAEPPGPPLYRRPPEERRAALLPYVGRPVRVEHAPTRDDRGPVYGRAGRLVAVATLLDGAGGHVAVLHVGEGRADLAVPLAQVRAVLTADGWL